MKRACSHFRRCHVCGTTSEHNNFVSRCKSRGKVFAPYYYVDEGQSPSYTDHLERPKLLRGEFPPILGISTLWWNNRSDSVSS